MSWKHAALTLSLIIVALFLGGALGSQLEWEDGRPAWRDTDLESAFISMRQRQTDTGPLQEYSFPALSGYEGIPSDIEILRIVDERPTTIAVEFAYTTRGDRMTGQLTLPHNETATVPATRTSAASPTIVMLRGYVPPDTYRVGSGTRNAAHALADAGFVTVAPDFLGYGNSDDAPADTWEGRFIKPIQTLDLIASLLAADGLTLSSDITAADEPLPTETKRFLETYGTEPSALGIWAHSNGGQIALSSLIISEATYPTTLWAPVTAPFPYSILFFGDEQEDEGKQQRAWIAQFEQTYDVLDFSFTQHLDHLRAPLQIQQGGRDEAIPSVWNDEFVAKLATENDRRRTATDSSTLPPIDTQYYPYPTADHNMQGAWDTAVRRDITFFEEYLTR